jgi:ribonuclease-3 family protein
VAAASTRSIRTLAWLGDALFELEVRTRLSRRGDYPTERLDAMKASIVRAEAQSELLAQMTDELSEAEQDVVARARNATPPSGRGRRDTRAYREATGLEALVAWWRATGADDRFEALVAPRLETEIDQALVRDRKRPRRG